MQRLVHIDSKVLEKLNINIDEFYHANHPNLEKVNKYIKKLSPKVKFGDIVQIGNSDYRNNGKYGWNGETLIPLNWKDNGGYGGIPTSYVITNENSFQANSWTNAIMDGSTSVYYSPEIIRDIASARPEYVQSELHYRVLIKAEEWIFIVEHVNEMIKKFGVTKEQCNADVKMELGQPKPDLIFFYHRHMKGNSVNIDYEFNRIKLAHKMFVQFEQADHIDHLLILTDLMAYKEFLNERQQGIVDTYFSIRNLSPKTVSPKSDPTLDDIYRNGDVVYFNKGKINELLLPFIEYIMINYYDFIRDDLITDVTNIKKIVELMKKCAIQLVIKIFEILKGRVSKNIIWDIALASILISVKLYGNDWIQDDLMNSLRMLVEGYKSINPELGIVIHRKTVLILEGDIMKRTDWKGCQVFYLGKNYDDMFPDIDRENEVSEKDYKKMIEYTKEYLYGGKIDAINVELTSYLKDFGLKEGVKLYKYYSKLPHVLNVSIDYEYLCSLAADNKRSLVDTFNYLRDRILIYKFETIPLSFRVIKISADKEFLKKICRDIGESLENTLHCIKTIFIKEDPEIDLLSFRVIEIKQKDIEIAMSHVKPKK